MKMKSIFALAVIVGSTGAMAEGSDKTQLQTPQHSVPKKEMQTLLIKLSEIVKTKQEPSVLLKLRFDCEPTRYTAWIVSKEGVSDGEAEIQLDKTVRWKLKAEKRGPRVLALEDSKGESERTFFDRLKGVSLVTAFYKTSKGKTSKASFMVAGVHKQLKDSEDLCFKD